MSTHTVLLTRPRDESEKLAEIVRARGLEALIEPMLEIVPLAVDLPDLKQFQALIFTSRNGVESFCRLSPVRDLPVFTVGNTTAACAAANGFRDVSTGDADVAGLNKTLKYAGLLQGVPVLHVSGEHTVGDIALMDVPIGRLVTYRADKTQALSAACLDLLDAGGIAVAMFYSPRTAENFTELIRRCGRESKISSIKALCISEAVVQCLADLPWQSVQVANTPTRNGMMRLLDDFAAGLGKQGEHNKDGISG